MHSATGCVFLHIYCRLNLSIFLYLSRDIAVFCDLSAHPARIYGVDADTSHFTGNYPPRFSIQAACLDEGVSRDCLQPIAIFPMSILPVA